MSDTLTNALQQSAHSSTVLQGIMNPTVVNPLAGMGSAITAVSGMQGLASKQGEQLVGQALQQATDPKTGVLDTLKAQQIAASMGPNAAYAMQGFLKTGSQLRGEQITQAGGLDTLTSGLAASAIADSSDENLARIRARGVAAGMPPSALAEIDRIAAIPDVGQRKLEAWKHLSGQMGASYNLGVGGFPTPAATTVGDRIVPTGLQPPSPYGPGSMNVQQGGVTVSMTPAEANQPYKYTDASGVEHSTTVGEHLRTLGVPVQIGGQQVGAPASSGAPNAAAVPRPPANYVARPAPAVPAPPAASPSGNPATSGTPGGPNTYPGSGMGVLPGPGASLSTGGGVNVASANPSFAPSVGAVAQPSPAVAGDVNAIMAGMNQARTAPQGGTQTAWNALQSGGVPPAVPAPAPQAAVPPTPQQPATTGRSIPGPAPGVVPAAQETGKQSATMGGALITRGDQAPVQKANLQNMMTDLSKLDSMGPGTDKEIFLNSVMQKLTGYGFSMNRDQVAAGNSFAKLANIAVGQQLAAIGGTDARQSLFMGSNPHLDMSKLGNERIIHMLMGNEDAIQAKSRAWTAWSQSHGDDTYRQFQDDFNRHFDPRVFQSQYMAKGGPELAALRASLEKEGTPAVNKFKDDAAYAKANRWIQ